MRRCCRSYRLLRITNRFGKEKHRRRELDDSDKQVSNTEAPGRASRGEEVPDTQEPRARRAQEKA